eukprot:symbB.v1.2.039593.t1/scaffold6673.1/size16291/1
MFAVFDDETQSWWYTEVNDHQAVEVSEETEDVMVISCVLGSHGDSWLHETGEDLDLIEENEPNTHVTDTHVMSHVMALNDEIGNHGNQETAELSSSVEVEGFASLRGECGGKLPLDELFGAPGSCSGSEGTKVQDFGGSLNPLLNSIGKDNIPSDYWLIDSGASCSVINKKSLEGFCHTELIGTGNSAFTAANGTPVLFCGRCEIVVKVRALDSTTGKVKPGVFKIPVMVGETPYNILSTYVLGKRGWKTVLTDSVSVVHEKSNVQMNEVMIWCDTPWVRVKPHHGSELILSHVEAGDNSVQGQEVSEPVVRNSLGEALEEYAPTTPEEEVLFKDGGPEADLPPERPEPPVKRIKTRHCPACETGPAISGLPEDEVPMNDQNDDQKQSEPEGLPIGHDLAHVHDMEVDGPEYMDTEVAMTSRNMKRESDVHLENLEDEIRRETETDRQKVSHVLSSMVSAAFGVSDYVPLSDMVDSVQFAAESDFAVMTFGNQEIKIWKPSSAVDDSDMSELPGDQTHDGMIKEVGNLRDMEAGDLMTLE